eukprot:scaffold26148_cov61-Phaeocystis_antarctica.AAC.3
MASQSTRAAPLRSLACVPGPLHPARRSLPPQRRTRLAHTPQCACTAALQGVVPAATHHAAGSRSSLSDYKNNRIRRVDISTGATTTLAGSGSAGFKDDVGTNAQFNKPSYVAIAPNGAFALVAVRLWPPAHRLAPCPPQRRTRLAHSHPRPAPPPSKVWCWPPPHTAPSARSSLSVCSRSMHRRTKPATASAVSTSAPERPPPSPAAAYGALGTTSAPAHNSPPPLASQSTRSATSCSLLCVPDPLHPRVVAFPSTAHPPRTHAPVRLHSRPPRCGARHHTPRRRLAPRSACARAQCIAGLL